MKKAILIIVVLAMSFMLMAAGYEEKEVINSAEDFVQHGINDLEMNGVPYTIERTDSYVIIRFDNCDYPDSRYVGSNPIEVLISENCIIMHSTGTYSYNYGD